MDEKDEFDLMADDKEMNKSLTERLGITPEMKKKKAGSTFKQTKLDFKPAAKGSPKKKGKNPWSDEEVSKLILLLHSSTLAYEKEIPSPKFLLSNFHQLKNWVADVQKLCITYMRSRIRIWIQLFTLKVVGNEKKERSGRWQMLGF